MRKSRLFWASGCLLVALPVSADCVKCDIFHDCVGDVTGTACSCNIKVVKGSTICREVDFCDSTGSCNGGPGPVIAESPGTVIEAAALNQLTEREPLLGLLISGSLMADSKGRVQLLNTEPYDGGTLRMADGEIFQHRGSFLLRASGEVAFRFTVTNVNSMEKIQYVGTISDRGQDIRFSKILTDVQGTSRRLSENWHYEPK